MLMNMNVNANTAAAQPPPGFTAPLTDNLQSPKKGQISNPPITVATVVAQTSHQPTEHESHGSTNVTATTPPPTVSPPPEAASTRATAPPKDTDITDAHSLSLKTLVDAAKDVPVLEEAVMDKVHFIFNNVSVSNMDQKAAELKELLKVFLMLNIVKC
jgi:hypothetical protein